MAVIQEFIVEKGSAPQVEDFLPTEKGSGETTTSMRYHRKKSG